MILRRHLLSTLRSTRPPLPFTYQRPSAPHSRLYSSTLSSPLLSSNPRRSFSVAAAPSPVPLAVNTPQTLSSLDVLTSDLLTQRESLHLKTSAWTPRRSLSQEAGFRAINDHALIGQCRTAALVGLDGCIDWYCFPHFDSPSVFGALVDSQRGGHFTVRPVFDGPAYHQQAYEVDSNVLTTTLSNQERDRQKKSTERRFKLRPVPSTVPQELTITDFLPMADEEDAEGLHWLIRQLHCTRGPMTADIQCFPAFDYGRAQQTVGVTEGGVKFLSDGLCMTLTVSCPVQWTVSANKRGVFGRIQLNEGDRATLLFRELSPAEAAGAIDPHPLSRADALLQRTRDYWFNWMQQCTYRGRWAASVRRSALALKLLVFAPEGSCVAAPTTSLPETLGGTRNWDYRYAWVRDSSFIIAALLRLGFKAESRAFIAWLQRRAADLEGGVEGHGLQALYGLRGEKRLTEMELKHLRGYLHSRPVRIGNGAYDQIQLDIYGEMMETVYLAHETGARVMDLELWRSLRPCIDWIVAHRQDRDEGVWEVRGGKQSFTYSRLMIWIAIDRAIRLAEDLQRRHGGGAWTGQGATQVGVKADASEYGAGHQRSKAVQRAQDQRAQVQRGEESAVPEPQAVKGAQRAGAKVTGVGSTLTSPGLPASQHMDARTESASYLSAITSSQAKANAANGAPASSPDVLPLELCEGCTIPAPAPNSPQVTHRPAPTSSLSSSPTLSSPTASTAEVFPGLLSSDLEWWRGVRAALFDQLMNQGYSEKRQAFVQHCATPPHPCTCTVLDASCLAFPLYGFLPADHPRIVSTLNAILSPIGEGGLMQNLLVYRYNVQHTADGFGGEEEGTFALCSNWAIEGLARWGRCGHEAALQRAEVMMEQMVGLSNHLDLYSEELLLHKGKIQPGGQQSIEHAEKGMMKEEAEKTKVKGGEGGGLEGEEDGEADDLYEEENETETRYLQIGNFVQGFSHLAFVNAAIELNQGLQERDERVNQHRKDEEERKLQLQDEQLKLQTQTQTQTA